MRKTLVFISSVLFLTLNFSVAAQDTAWVTLAKQTDKISQHKEIEVDNSYIHTYKNKLGIWQRVQNNKDLEELAKHYSGSLQAVEKINGKISSFAGKKRTYVFFPFSEKYLSELKEAGVERLTRVSREGEFIWPVVGVRITSRIGRRWGRYHSGLDIAAPIGTPVVAARSGVVIDNSTHRGYGILIKIQHGKEQVTYYAHLDVALLKKGDIVKKGQLIGYSGNTGRSTGPHLHFEVQSGGVVLNPEKFLPAFETSMESAWEFKSFLQEKVN